jgi:hypothetical protein
MKLKGIGHDTYQCTSYAKVILYLPGKDQNKELICAAVDAELRIVRDLEPGLLLGMDVLGSENAVIDGIQRMTVREQAMVMPLQRIWVLYVAQTRNWMASIAFRSFSRRGSWTD